VRKYLLDTGVTFDDRRILETWVVNGRFPLQFIATGTEDMIALAKGTADQAALYDQKGRRAAGRRVGLLYLGVCQRAASECGKALH
jgi:hypothetical protein